MNDAQDDQLLSELGQALAAADPVPDDVVTGAHAAYMARNLDAELAQLIFDSETDREPVLTRGSSVRNLSFATADMSIDIEIQDSPRRIVGQVAPARVVEVDLEFEGLVVQTTTSDDLGRFRFDNVPAGTVCIVCRAVGEDSWRVCTVYFDV